MILYIIPKNNFFYKGWTGSTSHAIGVCKGIVKSKRELLLCANKSDIMTNDLTNGIDTYSNSLVSIFLLLKLKRNKIEKVIIRYSISSVFKIFIISFFTKFFKINSNIEINTLYGFYKKSFLKNIKYVESLLLILFDSVHVVSSGSKSDPAIKLFHKNIFYVPNGHSLKIIKNTFPNLNFKKIVTLKYLGSIQDYYNFNDIKVLIKKRKNFNLYIYGNHKQDLISKNIIYKGKYSNNNFTSLVNINTDLLFLPYKSNSIADYGFPTKLSEYLTTGAIIISTNTGVLKNILGAIDEKLMYDDGDITSLEKAIDYSLSLSIKQRVVLTKKYRELSIKLKWHNLVNYIINEKNYS